MSAGPEPEAHDNELQTRECLAPCHAAAKPIEATFALGHSPSILSLHPVSPSQACACRHDRAALASSARSMISAARARPSSGGAARAVARKSRTTAGGGTPGGASAITSQMRMVCRAAQREPRSAAAAALALHALDAQHHAPKQLAPAAL